MTHNKKIHLMLKRTAELVANASSLRGRPRDTIKKAREFLKRLKPRHFVVQSEKAFQKKLNASTKRLLERFPKKAGQDWGAARKVLNIFMRDVLYSRDLCNHFKFKKIEKFLEVPLDGDVAKGLREDTKKYKLQKLDSWPRIKRLKVDLSTCYQEAAKKIAPKYNFSAPVHLDLVYWRRKQRKKKPSK